MSIDFKLPDLGENIESGDVVSLLVNEGDLIAADQNVVELETDKAVVEIPCPHAGKVAKIHVKPGDSVPIGGLLVTIDEKASASSNGDAQPPQADAAAAAPAEEAKTPAKPAPPAAAQVDEEDPPPPPKRSAAPKQPAAASATSSNGGARVANVAAATATSSAGVAGVAAGPATRRLARELGVDLQNVAGSGPGGRITREDVIAAVRESAAAAPASRRKKSGGAADGPLERDSHGPVRRQALSKIRKTIAANMAKSAATIPHVTNFDDADTTELDRIRKGSMANNVGSGVKLTMMPFVMKAVALALRQHPLLNASLDLEAGETVFKEYVNLGVAVDTERGLVVPVVRDVDQMSIPQLAQVLGEMTEKARGNQFSLDDLRGGTFTISNLGAIGGTYSTPIINHPEVAILLVGRSRKTPVVVEDRIEPRLMMPLSLSYDHRLVDGAVAARFLNEVKNYLEVPGRLLLAT